MGFLDHSTNNIIVDAVLTDTGREFLAANKGDFKIAFFSLSDDEVDYTIIEKFGRSVGKEKIIKNTPIFEAQTVGTIAQKHRMLSLPDPSIVRLPTVSIEGTAGLSGNTVAFNTSSNTSRRVVFEQTIEGETRIPDGVSDTSFTVEVPDRFISVSERTPFNIEASTRIASYTVQAGVPNEMNGASVEFTLQLQPGLDDTVFKTYGNQGNKNTITAVVAIIGDQSGYRKDFSVTITRPSA